MRRNAALAGLLAAAGALLAPSLAAAATTCSYDAGSKSITLVADQSARIVFAADGDIAVELFDGSDPVDCGDGTRFNADTITATGPGGDLSSLFLDGRQAPFGPGVEDESPGIAEIEIAVSAFFNVVVDGHLSEPNTFSFGQEGAGLNTDDDMDLTYAGDHGIVANGGAGGDVFTANGSTASAGGLPVATNVLVSFRNALTSGAGDDLFIGHDGSDLLEATGADRLSAYGLGGDDFITSPFTDSASDPGAVSILDGGRGRDTLVVNGGDAEMYGGPGSDTFSMESGDGTAFGGRGKDVFFADDDLADTIFGNAGIDRATVDCGLDAVSGVESTNCP